MQHFQSSASVLTTAWMIPVLVVAFFTARFLREWRAKGKLSLFRKNVSICYINVTRNLLFCIFLHLTGAFENVWDNANTHVSYFRLSIQSILHALHHPSPSSMFSPLRTVVHFAYTEKICKPKGQYLINANPHCNVSLLLTFTYNLLTLFVAKPCSCKIACDSFTIWMTEPFEWKKIKYSTM